MFGPNSPPMGTPPPPKAPGSALATTLGAVAVFFAAPKLERTTEPAIRDYAYAQWGEWTASVIGPLWWMTCGALIFFAVRAMTPRVLKMIEARAWWRALP